MMAAVCVRALLRSPLFAWRSFCAALLPLPALHDATTAHSFLERAAPRRPCTPRMRRRPACGGSEWDSRDAEKPSRQLHAFAGCPLGSPPAPQTRPPCTQMNPRDVPYGGESRGPRTACSEGRGGGAFPPALLGAGFGWRTLLVPGREVRRPNGLALGQPGAFGRCSRHQGVQGMVRRERARIAFLAVARLLLLTAAPSHQDLLRPAPRHPAVHSCASSGGGAHTHNWRGPHQVSGDSLMQPASR